MRSNMNQHFIQKALPQAKWVWDRLLGTPGFWSILSSVIMATVASCDPKTSEMTAPARHQTRQLVPEISACGKMYPEKHMENVCQAHGCYHSFHHWQGVMLDNISKLTSWINSPQCSFVYIGNNLFSTSTLESVPDVSKKNSCLRRRLPWLSSRLWNPARQRQVCNLLVRNPWHQWLRNIGNGELWGRTVGINRVPEWPCRPCANSSISINDDPRQPQSQHQAPPQPRHQRLLDFASFAALR